jgi:hypothetical protein
MTYSTRIYEHVWTQANLYRHYLSVIENSGVICTASPYSQTAQQLCVTDHEEILCTTVSLVVSIVNVNREAGKGRAKTCGAGSDLP